MPRKRSGMDLPHSWWPEINCVHSLSIVKHTAPSVVAQSNVCPLPASRVWRVRVSRSGSGRDWAGCQESGGAAVSPAGSAGGGSICFLSGVWLRADLSSSWAEGWKASASSCGRPQGAPTWQLPSSEGNREKSQGGREGKRETGRGRGVVSPSFLT